MSETHVLIDQALARINKIRSIKETVMASKSLDGVETQLSKAEDYLKAIKNIDGLKIHDFSTEVEDAVKVLQECESLSGKLPSISINSSQMTPVQLASERPLKPMPGLLDEALQRISLRVLNTPVGLTGNYHVKHSILYETNEKVKEVFGNNLALMDFLEKENMIDKQGKSLSIGVHKYFQLEDD